MSDKQVAEEEPIQKLAVLEAVRVEAPQERVAPVRMAQVCGGWSGARSAEGLENSQLIKKHIDEIRARLGLSVEDKIEFLTHSTQVVAGTNNNITGKVGDKHFSLQIWEKIGPDRPSELSTCGWSAPPPVESVDENGNRVVTLTATPVAAPAVRTQRRQVVSEVLEEAAK